MVHPDRSTLLTTLDAAMLQTWQVLQMPAYRQRLQQALGSDLSLGTLRVLRGVERATGEAHPSVGDVADLLGIDPSTASRAVEDGVARGYLLRRACPSDRRRQRLCLTDSGAALLQRANAVRCAVLAEVTTSWNLTDLDQLAQQLTRLTEDFDDRLGTT